MGGAAPTRSLRCLGADHSGGDPRSPKKPLAHAGLDSFGPMRPCDHRWRDTRVIRVHGVFARVVLGKSSGWIPIEQALQRHADRLLDALEARRVMWRRVGCLSVTQSRTTIRAGISAAWQLRSIDSSGRASVPLAALRDDMAFSGRASDSVC